jgi:hypothetical protein
MHKTTVRLNLWNLSITKLLVTISTTKRTDREKKPWCDPNPLPRLLCHATNLAVRSHVSRSTPSQLVPALREVVLNGLRIKTAALFLRHLEVLPFPMEATSAPFAVTPSILPEDVGWAAVAGLGLLEAVLKVYLAPQSGFWC